MVRGKDPIRHHVRRQIRQSVMVNPAPHTRFLTVPIADHHLLCNSLDLCLFAAPTDPTFGAETGQRSEPKHTGEQRSAVGGRRGPCDRCGQIRIGPRIESGQFSLDPDDQTLIDPVEADTAGGGAWSTRNPRDLSSGIGDQRDIAESSRLRSTGDVSRGRSVRNFHGTWRAKGQKPSFEPMSRLASANEAA
jgi:hypothetical protein